MLRTGRMLTLHPWKGTVGKPASVLGEPSWHPIDPDPASIGEEPQSVRGWGLLTECLRVIDSLRPLEGVEVFRRSSEVAELVG